MEVEEQKNSIQDLFKQRTKNTINLNKTHNKTSASQEQKFLKK